MVQNQGAAAVVTGNPERCGDTQFLPNQIRTQSHRFTMESVQLPAQANCWGENFRPFLNC